MSDDEVPRVITDIGTITCDSVSVKVSGWVVCRRDGETFHYPAHRVKQIKGDQYVSHQSPHGRV